MLPLRLCCCHLEILNFLTKGLHFQWQRILQIMESVLSQKLPNGRTSDFLDIGYLCKEGLLGIAHLCQPGCCWHCQLNSLGTPCVLGTV